MKIFMTGTDTHVGKTYVSVRLLRVLNLLNFNTIGAKLVATGCEKLNGKYVNADVLQLQAAASVHVPYEILNPFALPQAVAPHIAAKQSGMTLTTHALNCAFDNIIKIPADIYLFEGVGGWYIPLNDHDMMSHMIKKNELAVILVVGIRLGCLNHSLLTVRAMLADKVNVIGWIANSLDPHMECIEANIDYLTQTLKVPCLGKLNFNSELKLRSHFCNILNRFGLIC